MLQNPQVASMLTPFHHAAAMQAAALHHAAASQNNSSAISATPSETTSLFNSSLNVPNSLRDHHPSQTTLTGSTATNITPLGGVRMSPSGGIASQHPHKELPPHPHGTHLPPPANPHQNPASLPPMGPPPSTGGPHPHIPPGHFLPHPHHNHLHPHHPHLGLEPPKPRFMFKMPRVVPNQKEKFESDDLMKRHSREGEVRFYVDFMLYILPFSGWISKSYLDIRYIRLRIKWEFKGNLKAATKINKSQYARVIFV